MEKTWRPVASGVLMIITGAFWGVGRGTGALDGSFSAPFCGSLRLGR
jgi:hypothetical protein